MPNSRRNICKEQKHQKIRNTKKERDGKHAKLSQEHLQGTEASKVKKNTKKERDGKTAKLSQDHLQGTEAQKDNKQKEREGPKTHRSSFRKESF